MTARKSGKTYQQCASVVGRTVKQIAYKLSYMGATKPHPNRGKRLFEIRWSARELRLTQLMYPQYSAPVISRRIGRSAVAVRERASELGIRKREPIWGYHDLAAILTSIAPPRCITLSCSRTSGAIANAKLHLRRLFAANRLDEYLQTRPGAPKTHCLRFGRTYPPGLKICWRRLSKQAQNRHVQDYLAREAARARQNAAWKKWKARQAK